MQDLLKTMMCWMVEEEENDILIWMVVVMEEREWQQMIG